MSTELPRRQRTTGTRAKICIVASEYNEQYTQALVENCSEELKTVLPSVRLEIIRVPGAFEIPVAIKSVLSRSPEKRPDAVVALGVILQHRPRGPYRLHHYPGPDAARPGIHHPRHS